jgi:glycosyltransferase involved in cell wall biosynthesis
LLYILPKLEKLVKMSNQVKPLVSVKTITYNHAPYIRRCIEGVLMQKTTFPFELVIGEDCSTDGTREIVLDYAKKYPEIIRVITSESNVGAKENSIRTNLACQGEYIAFCEGDDYWIDPLKLQKQYEAIIEHNAVLVTHDTLVVFFLNGKIVYDPKLRRPKDASGFLDPEDIISKRAQFHTSSLFLRAETLKKFPDWFYQAPVYDWPLKVICAYLGKVYYIDEIMSVFQKGVPGSYNARARATRIENGWDDAESELIYLKMLTNLDNYTGYQYSYLIKDDIANRSIEFYNACGNLDHLGLKPIYRKILRVVDILTQSMPQPLRKKFLRKVVYYIQKKGLITITT